MKDTSVLIEKYKGFDICYDKEKERFVADKPKLDIHFAGRSLLEIKEHIKESKTEEVDKFAYIKSGYFGKRIAKIHILTTNKITKKCDYKIIEDTECSYEVGRLQEHENLPKTYEINEHNKGICDKVKKLQEEINDLEKKQKQYVAQLK